MLTKKKFTPEEIKILKANSNTYSVNENKISLTLKAKQKMLTLLETTTPRNALKSLGYDPDVFGPQRIKSIVKHLKMEAESNAGLHEGSVSRRKKTQMTSEEIEELEFNKESFVRLRNEVNLLRGEVELLKEKLAARDIEFIAKNIQNSTLSNIQEVLQDKVQELNVRVLCKIAEVSHDSN